MFVSGKITCFCSVGYMSQSHRLQGYEVCPGCDSPVVAEISVKTGGRCIDCYLENLGKLKVLEVQHLGRRQSAPVVITKRHKRKVKDKRAEKAKLRALKRMRAIVPALYDVLLAEERVKEGLEPFTVHAMSGNDVLDAQETLAFAEVYDALVEQGVPFDDA
jgi:hypothetical protein